MENNSRGLRYHYINPQCHEVAGKGFCFDRHIVIPKYHNKHRVTRIRATAFQNEKKLESMIIPEGVTSIGSEAFKGCTSLRTIVLPSTLTDVQSEAFHGCVALTTVKGLENVTAIHESAFEGCSALVELHLSQAQRIGRNAFQDSGILHNEASWSGNVLAVDGWILAFRPDCDFYTIKKDVHSLADGSIDAAMHIDMVRNPDYESQKQRYDADRSFYDNCFGACLRCPEPFTEDPPIEFFEVKRPIKIQYEGTITDWEKLTLPRGWFSYPIEVYTIDGRIR